MNSAIPFCKHINLDAIEYKGITSNKKGQKVVAVSTIPGSTDLTSRLRFQMSENQNAQLQVAVWTLSTPMQGQDASRRTLEVTIDDPNLFHFLEALDKSNVDVATSRCEEWFKKKMDSNTISGMYVPIMRAGVKQDMPYSMRVKVNLSQPYGTNIFVVTDLVDNQLMYHKGGPDDLTKGAKMMIVAETAGLWFMSKQFGMSINATDILVWPNRKVYGMSAFSLIGVKPVEQYPSPNIVEGE
jgi:hypothetical protein